jgi:iron complex transport system substrate-binding protein
VVRRAFRLLPAVAAAGLLAAGCSQRTEPVGELHVDYPITVQGSGEAPFELQSPPERIVALDAGSAELIDALGAGDRLVGVPAGVTLSSGGSPREIVRSTGKIDVAAVAELEPDLVVATPDTDRVDVAQVEQRTDAPVYLQPSRTIDDVQRAALELGFIVDQPATARQLVGSIEQSVAEITDRLRTTDPVTTFVDTGFFITVPDGSLLGDLLRQARGTNVAAASAGLGPVSADELVSSDPSVYLTTSDSGVSLGSLQRNPDTAELTAVREGRVVELPSELVMRPGPNVARGLEAVAVALHPDAFR